MNVLVHTRSDFPKSPQPDIITFVEYIRKCYFSKAIYWLCKTCGYEYYDKDSDDEEKTEDPCLKFLDDVEPSQRKKDDPLIHLDESVLDEYIDMPNIWFHKEGISLKTQKEFGVRFSIQDQRIIIPVYDELGNLIGTKGRTIEEENEAKYLAVHPFPKSKVLYGLNKTYEHIKRKGYVFVFEAEKSVQQAYCFGVKCSLATMGHKISETQAIKLEKLGVKIIFAFDKGLSEDDIKSQAQKFMFKDRLYYIWDKNNLLKDKESPSDHGSDLFKKLLKTSVKKIK